MQEVKRRFTQTITRPTTELRKQTKQTVGRRTCASSTYNIKQHADRRNTNELSTSKQPQAHTIHVLNTDKIAHQCASASLASQDYGTTTKVSNIFSLNLNQVTAAQRPNISAQVLSNIYELDQANKMQQTLLKTQATYNQKSSNRT